MKVKQYAGRKCFVTTLNSNDSALPQAVLKANATVGRNVEYMVSHHKQIARQDWSHENFWPGQGRGRLCKICLSSSLNPMLYQTAHIQYHNVTDGQPEMAQQYRTVHASKMLGYWSVHVV